MNSITVADVQVSIVEYDEKRVITFAMTDALHMRPEGTAKRNFTENRPRFVEGEDFYLIDFSKKDEFRRFGIEVPPRGLIVLTESGYLMLVKSLTDDRAWQVQRQLVKGYFRAKEQQTAFRVPETLPDALRLAADLAEAKARVEAEKEILQSKVEEQAPKVEALERISAADGDLPLQVAAKALQQPPNKFCNTLRQKKWIYKRPGGKRNIAYQDKIVAGYLNVKTATIIDAEGNEFLKEQVMVTPRGLAKLSELISSGAMA